MKCEIGTLFNQTRNTLGLDQSYVFQRYIDYQEDPDEVEDE